MPGSWSVPWSEFAIGPWFLVPARRRGARSIFIVERQASAGAVRRRRTRDKGPKNGPGTRHQAPRGAQRRANAARGRTRLWCASAGHHPASSAMPSRPASAAGYELCRGRFASGTVIGSAAQDLRALLSEPGRQGQMTTEIVWRLVLVEPSGTFAVHSASQDAISISFDLILVHHWTVHRMKVEPILYIGRVGVSEFLLQTASARRAPRRSRR